MQQLYKKSVLAFPDCVVINIPLQSNATKSELTGIAYIQGRAVHNSGAIFIAGSRGTVPVIGAIPRLSRGLYTCEPFRVA